MGEGEVEAGGREGSETCSITEKEEKQHLMTGFGASNINVLAEAGFSILISKDICYSAACGFSTYDANVSLK